MRHIKMRDARSKARGRVVRPEEIDSSTTNSIIIAEPQDELDL
jgi:hypothetical protein